MVGGVYAQRQRSLPRPCSHPCAPVASRFRPPFHPAAVPSLVQTYNTAAPKLPSRLLSRTHSYHLGFLPGLAALLYLLALRGGCGATQRAHHASRVTSHRDAKPSVCVPSSRNYEKYDEIFNNSETIDMTCLLVDKRNQNRLSYTLFRRTSGSRAMRSDPRRA